MLCGSDTDTVPELDNVAVGFDKDVESLMVNNKECFVADSERLLETLSSSLDVSDPDLL